MREDDLDALADLFDHGRPWHRLAACRGQGPEGFFPPRGAEGQAARAAAARLCATCPVTEPCAAQGAREQHGVWAGVSAAVARRRQQHAASAARLPDAG